MCIFYVFRCDKFPVKFVFFVSRQMHNSDPVQPPDKISTDIIFRNNILKLKGSFYCFFHRNYAYIIFRSLFIVLSSQFPCFTSSHVSLLILHVFISHLFGLLIRTVAKFISVEIYTVPSILLHFCISFENKLN